MILTRNTLHIVELKYYSGTISGTDTRWRRDNGGRSRSEDSPLMLAQKKARVFASRLKDEFAVYMVGDSRLNIAGLNRNFAQLGAFVHLVEQHGRHAGKLRVGLEAGQEHAMGHGDEVAVVDRNFPAVSIGARVVRLGTASLLGVVAGALLLLRLPLPRLRQRCMGRSGG